MEEGGENQSNNEGPESTGTGGDLGGLDMELGGGSLCALGTGVEVNEVARDRHGKRKKVFSQIFLIVFEVIHWLGT